MSFKILVTTRAAVGEGGGVHTLVVDFDEEKAAIVALRAIRAAESRRGLSRMTQTAIALWDPNICTENLR